MVRWLPVFKRRNISNSQIVGDSPPVTDAVASANGTNAVIWTSSVPVADSVVITNT